MHLDRSHIVSVSFEENELRVIEEMKNSTPQDRFILITYLRESFYGPEASTGRLQRVFEVSKFE
jgi:hypothetical protein